MTKFKKGCSGNPQGRPIGAKNRVKTQVVEMLGNFLADNASTIQSLFDELTDPRDKLKFIVSVLPFIIPKQQTERAEDKPTAPPPNFIVTDRETMDVMKKLDECGNSIYAQIVNGEISFTNSTNDHNIRFSVVNAGDELEQLRHAEENLRSTLNKLAES